MDVHLQSVFNDYIGNWIKIDGDKNVHLTKICSIIFFVFLFPVTLYYSFIYKFRYIFIHKYIYQSVCNGL